MTIDTAPPFGHCLSTNEPLTWKLNNKIVCLIGRLEEYNVHCNLATVHRSNSTITITTTTTTETPSMTSSLVVMVDTSLLGVFDYRIGSWYKWYGELSFASNGAFINDETAPVLKARILWCVDGMDLALYDRCVQIRRHIKAH
jgi:hypothetical protein